MLVRADSEEEVLSKLRTDQASSYKNEFGETLVWRQVGVLGIAPVLYNDLTDVTELYSRTFYGRSDYNELIPPG